MGREWIVSWAGKTQKDEWESLCARYRERIGHHVAIRERVIRPATGDVTSRLREESRAFRESLPDPVWTVALDRGGKSYKSEQLAEWIRKKKESWPHPIAFIIGSDIGLDRGFVGECRERLSLGPMTLPHELARLVLLEQLYRGISILAGIKYHRGPL